MNDFLLIDAISCLDSDLLEKHLCYKKLNTKQAIKKRRLIFRWFTVAACICIVVATSIITLSPFIEDILTGETRDVYFEGETMKASGIEITLVEENHEDGLCSFE